MAIIHNYTIIHNYSYELIDFCVLFQGFGLSKKAARIAAAIRAVNYLHQSGYMAMRLAEKANQKKSKSQHQDNAGNSAKNITFQIMANHFSFFSQSSKYGLVIYPLRHCMFCQQISLDFFVLPISVHIGPEILQLICQYFIWYINTKVARIAAAVAAAIRAVDY